MVKKLKLSLFGCLLLLILAGWLFFNHLGQTPLRSWDEAWYAEISRNILKKNHWFLLEWNGLPYYDHPPLGFWLMAVSFKIFGISEFAARLPSALAGFGSIILIYLIGRKLFSESAGLGAGIILTTSPWFWLRAREGNLDIILTFFILLTFFQAIKAKTDKRWFFGLGASFGLALLTKTIIGLGLLPTILYLTHKPICKPIYEPKQKLGFRNFLIAFGGFLVSLAPWYLANYQTYGRNFIERNLFITGLKLPGYKGLFSKNIPLSIDLGKVFYNLHMGILLWYKPFLVSLAGSLLFLKNKSFRVLFLWLLPYLLVFSLSAKIELWHLIILYPVVALIIASFLTEVAKRIPLAYPLVFLFLVWNGNRIVSGLYKDIVKNQPLNDEVELSRLAGQKENLIYIDDDYWPAAVFYSQKKVYSIPHSTDTKIKTVNQLFLEEKRPFLLITKDWILQREEISPENYLVLKQIGERVLIQSK